MLVTLLLGTLSILLTQVGLAGALAGIGLATRRAFGLRVIALDDCFLAFWIGLAGVTLLLLCWNFFLPISGWTTIVVLTLGTLGLWWVRPALATLFARARRPSSLITMLLILAALWVGNLSLGALDNYDSGLYHLQVVRWAEQYPAIPGIGNLDGPLAFNNSSLLFDAMLSAGPWQGRSNHLANGLFVLVFLWQAIVAGARLAAGERRPRRLFEFMLLAPAVGVGLRGRVSAFVTDLPTSLVVLVAATAFYAMLTDEDDAGLETDFRVVAIAALVALAVTFKTNAAIFAAICFPLTIALWLKRTRPDRVRRSHTLPWALGVVTVLAAAWTGRGIVLSGYPLFPTNVAALPVEWRVPAEHAEAEFAYIVHSGRASTRNLPVVAGEVGLRGWVPSWARLALDDPYEIAVPVAVAILALVAWIALCRRDLSDARNSRPWWLAVPIAAAVGSWFVVAPEPRYIMPYLWSLAALAASQAGAIALDAASSRARHFLLLTAAGLGFSPVLVSPLTGTSRALRSNPFLTVVKENVNRPGSDLWFQPLAGKANLHTYRTRSGLHLNVATDQCWDTPLPCTPNPAPNLRLRDPTNMAKGFVVDGPWQMENWPLSWQPGFLAAWRRSRVRRGGPG